MATREELEQKINKLEVNMNRTDRIVNGGEDEDVLIDGGQLVPSIRKWQKELGEEYGFPKELVQQAEDAADRAEDATNRVLEVPTYTSGLELTSYNQLIRDSNGEFWRVSGQVDLPYVTTGAGIPEDDALVPAGDAVLRQDLSDPDKGAAMVARGVVAVDSIADLLALPEGQRKVDLQYIVKGAIFSWDGSAFIAQTPIPIDAFGDISTVDNSALLQSALDFLESQSQRHLIIDGHDLVLSNHVET